MISRRPHTRTGYDFDSGHLHDGHTLVPPRAQVPHELPPRHLHTTRHWQRDRVLLVNTRHLARLGTAVVPSPGEPLLPRTAAKKG